MNTMKKMPVRNKPIISCRECGYYEVFDATWNCEADIRDLEHNICFHRRNLAAMYRIMNDVNYLIDIQTNGFEEAEEM